MRFVERDVDVFMNYKLSQIIYAQQTLRRY